MKPFFWWVIAAVWLIATILCVNSFYAAGDKRPSAEQRCQAISVGIERPAKLIDGDCFVNRNGEWERFE